MRLNAAFLLPFCLAVAGAASAAATGSDPVELALHVGGRTDPHGRQQWPGVYYEAAFEGDRVLVVPHDTANNFNVYVDGKLIQQIHPGQDRIEISAAPSGRHLLRLEKASESQDSAQGPMQVFVLGGRDGGQARALPAPSARARQIEFIGDSWTVGYGNTSPKRTCTKEEIWATTDTSLAYGPLTARHFDADYQINAYSGRGIVRNYDGVAAGVPLPVLYPYDLFDRATAYSDAGWHPQLIVIGLGGNDFSTPVHAGEKWATEDDLAADYVASYVAFLKDIRAHNPKAFLLVTTYKEPKLAVPIDKVVTRMKADGETRLDTVTIGDFELTGCDWHLSTRDDVKISDQMIAWIDAHAKIWQGR